MKRLTSLKGKNVKLIAIIVLAVILVTLPLYVENAYIMHLLIMTCVGTILGMTFSLLFSTGLISLGAAAFYAVGAYISAVLSMNFGFSFGGAFPVTVIASACLALGVGSIFVRSGGIAFAIITLLFASAIVLAAGQIEYLGGWGGIIGIARPTPVGPVEFTNKTAYYYLALVILALVILAFYALYTSRIGRAWKAIKLSPNLSGTLGINLYRYRLLAFVVAAAAAAAAGSFYAHYFQSITPGSFGGWLSIYIQLYAVLGGLEFYLLGPAVGAVLMTFIPEYLRVIKEYEPIVTGVLLLIVILFFPGGILGTIINSEKISGARLWSRISSIGTWVKKSR
ncbi:MAG: branched-chain amino acid ABC transporter permease [Chloroflexi bacterium]|nr:branched-chain amino acid ABC transporter permease [Chloroflexota bacterium]